MTAPAFTVLIPVGDVPADLGGGAVRSVLEQTWSDVEVLLVAAASDPGDLAAAVSSHPWVGPRLRCSDGRADVVGEARGEFVGVLGPSDTLAPDALEMCRRALQANPECDAVYTDEDWPDRRGREGTFLKPDWSPERLRGHMYIGRLALYRKTLVMQVAGFVKGLDATAEYDMALRAGEEARQIVHVPEVLCHRREPAFPTPPSRDPIGAVEEHCSRTGVTGWVEQTDRWGLYRVHREVHHNPLVSIVVPTRGSGGVVRGEQRTFVTAALGSVSGCSTYGNVEYVVVADDVMPAAVVEDLREICGDSLRLVPYSRRFNYSHKINLGVASSRGEYVILLNDDVEVITRDWIETMLGLAQQPDVGMVGCALYFEDGAMQHGGHVYRHGGAEHIGYGVDTDRAGTAAGFFVERECSGVTTACAMLRRTDFLTVGGMSRAFPVNYNDVDLSLKIRDLGRRVLWSPFARLYHFESKTRRPGTTAKELDDLRKRWGRLLDGDDPYWRDG